LSWPIFFPESGRSDCDLYFTRLEPLLQSEHLALGKLHGKMEMLGLQAQDRARLEAVVAEAMVLAFLYSENHEKLAYPVLVMDGGFFQPSEDLRSALEIARAIDAERAASGTDSLYVTQAWATAADVEFYSKNTGVFRRHTLLGDSQNFTVVYNKRFTVLEDAEFQETLAKCGPPEMETQNHVLLRSKPAAD
jgi:hypothetical protein